jgi:hypothetical protein
MEVPIIWLNVNKKIFIESITIIGMFGLSYLLLFLYIYMKFDISFNQIIKTIILNDNKLSLRVITNKSLSTKFYNNDYPNKKYSIDFIIDELIYVLKTGIS